VCVVCETGSCAGAERCLSQAAPRIRQRGQSLGGGCAPAWFTGLL